VLWTSFEGPRSAGGMVKGVVNQIQRPSVGSGLDGRKELRSKRRYRQTSGRGGGGFSTNQYPGLFGERVEPRVGPVALRAWLPRCGGAPQ